MMLVDDSDEPLPLRFIVRICTCPHLHMIEQRELSLLLLSVMERFYLNLERALSVAFECNGKILSKLRESSLCCF